MSVDTWLHYIVGDERAIREVADNNWSLLIGGLFVISAGFARTYRRYDLFHQSRFLLLPLAASLGSSAALFHLLYIEQWLAGMPRPPYFPAWLSFIGLFWMTAPLAWIYAVPFERWLDSTGAVKTRLGSLAIVSVWRIFLMIRVVEVVVGYGAGAATVSVLLFADLVAMLAIHWSTPRDRPRGLPLVTGMGAIMPARHADVRLIEKVGAYVAGLGCMALPALIVGLLVAISLSPFRGQWLHRDGGAAPPQAGLVVLAAGSVLAWFFVIPFTQPKQIRRYRVDELFRKGQIAQALAKMSAHAPEDFPANWEPPPAGQFSNEKGRISLLDIFDVMASHQVAPWLREAYLRQLKEFLAEALCYWLDDDSLLRTAALLDSLSEGSDLAKIAADAIEKLNDQIEEQHYPPDFRDDFLPSPSQQRTDAIEGIGILALKRGTKR